MLQALPAACAESPLERCRIAEFTLDEENFGKDWKDRVALEFEFINTASLESLRAGMDDHEFVRSMAA